MNDILGPHIKQDKWRSLKEKLYVSLMTLSQWKLKYSSNNKEVIKLVNGLAYNTDQG